MEVPPVPVFVGSPVWQQKVLIIRWKMQPSYLPEAQRARKFSQVLGHFATSSSILMSPKSVWRVTDIVFVSSDL